MSHSRLLVCTDMDRTVIPNGVQPESPNARKLFHDFCMRENVTLVYVTGRHESLVQQAIRNYCLPPPDYVITDVGTKIFKTGKEHWQVLSTWEAEIEKDWHPYKHAQLEALLADLPDLKLQERSKQNTHKLSYYLPLHASHNEIMRLMSERLNGINIKTSLVWSIDEPKGVGLLDVLPANATKLHAVEFLRSQLSFCNDEVIFAGDSGNDLPVMGSSIPSVLVANAAEDVRKNAIALAKKHNNLEWLYLANGKDNNMNGNYAAGVIEGIKHFHPDMFQS